MLVLAQSLPRLTLILLALSSCPHWRRDSVLILQALQHRPTLLWVLGHKCCSSLGATSQSPQQLLSMPNLTQPPLLTAGGIQPAPVVNQHRKFTFTDLSGECVTRSFHTALTQRGARGLECVRAHLFPKLRERRPPTPWCLWKLRLGCVPCSVCPCGKKGPTHE